MIKKCEIDGVEFDAKRTSQRFCSDRCRKRNHRKPGKEPVVVQLVPTAPFDTEPPSDEAPPQGSFEGPATKATRSQLEAAGRLDTALGVAALVAAMHVDQLWAGLRGAESGSGVKALLEAHRAALAEAVKDAKTAEDPLSKIRQSAALKLVQGGRS